MSPVTSPHRPASSIEACVAKSDIVCKTVGVGTTFLKKRSSLPQMQILCMTP